MSGSYLAGAEGEPVGDEGEDGAEENQDAPMESRGPLQQEAVRVEETPRSSSAIKRLAQSQNLVFRDIFVLIQDLSKETKGQNFSLAAEEQDSEVTEHMKKVKNGQI